MVRTGTTAFKACRECRQKKARCNGQSPCERCSSLGLHCVHDERLGETKDKLRGERSKLRAYEAASNVVLKALATRQHDKEALVALWRREPVEKIADELTRRNSRPKSIADSGKRSFGGGLDECPDYHALLHDTTNNMAIVPDGLSSELILASTGVDKPKFATSDVLDINRKSTSLNLAGSSGSAGLSTTCKYPQPKDTSVSLSEDSQTSGSFIARTPLGAPRLSSQTLFRSSEPTLRSSSQGGASSSCSPAVAKFVEMGGSTRASSSLDTASYFSHAMAGSGTALSSSHILSPTHLKTYPAVDTFIRDQSEQTALMVVPYRMARQFIDKYFEKQYAPLLIVRHDLFIKDFLAGDKLYCSSALIRIMCCLGCRVIGGHDVDQSYYAGLGDRLFIEASQVIRSPDGTDCSIPNAQALALMGLHQLAIGEHEEAQTLIDQSVQRLALMHRRQAEQGGQNGIWASVRETTLFGAVQLARMIRLAFAHITCPKPGIWRDGLPMSMRRKDPVEVDTKVEQLLSLPGLAGVAHSDQIRSQLPSIIFQLTEWIYVFVSRLHIVEGDALPRPLLDTYCACLSWYSSTLARKDMGQTPEPFVHLHYHFCLLTLFRPFCHVKSEDVSPIDICLEAGDAILTLAKMCGQLEGCHLFCFVPLFVHAAAQAEMALVGGEEKRGRSVPDRATKLLLELSRMYPSAMKAALELQGTSSPRMSALRVWKPA